MASTPPRIPPINVVPMITAMMMVSGCIPTRSPMIFGEITKPSSRFTTPKITSTRIGCSQSPNCTAASVTAFAITLGHVLGGSLVTEVVFNYPGLGNLLYLGIIARDYPLIQGLLLIMTLAILVANFVVDLIYVFLDPRLRRG